MASPERGWRKTVSNYPFWILAALLIMLTTLHYLSPQTRQLSPAADMFLSRHAVERILFIIPIAGATFAFGTQGGLITLGIAILIMFPRALWISPYLGDALVETAATAAVGGFLVWVIMIREKEKNLHQKAVSQLQAVGAVTAIVTESLELSQVLPDALEKTLEVTGLEAGLVFYLDPQMQELVLAAYRGLSEDSVVELDRIKLGEGFCGRVAQSGEMMVVQDSSRDPRLTRLAVKREGIRAQGVTPLKSRGKVQGVLAVATRRSYQFLPQDLDLMTEDTGKRAETDRSRASRRNHSSFHRSGPSPGTADHHVGTIARNRYALSRAIAGIDPRHYGRDAPVCPGPTAAGIGSSGAGGSDRKLDR